MAGLAFDADSPAVRLDDGLDEAEAQAEAAFGPALVAAEQPFPDPGLLVGGNAHPGVADAQDGAAAFARRPTISTRPPAGVYLMALSSRLAATCSSRVRSTLTRTPSSASRRQRDALRVGGVPIEIDGPRDDVGQRAPARA